VTDRKPLLLGTIVVVLALIAAMTPGFYRAGALAWAKWSARRTMKNLTPEEVAILNSTPVLIQLPQVHPNALAIEAVEVGDYSVNVPKAVSHKKQHRSMILEYSSFRVFILPPFSLAVFDAAARQLNFKNEFDEESASRHTRWQDLDAQADLPSLRRFLMLIAMKPSAMICREEFVDADRSGFIDGTKSGRHEMSTQIYIPKDHLGCGLIFTDEGGLKEDDIREYLAVVKFAPKPAASTKEAATTEMSHPAP
jgi:hypothetical protein